MQDGPLPRLSSQPLLSGVGSLPHSDAPKAIDHVLHYCAELPYWPQLPNRSPSEGMAVQVLPACGDLIQPHRGQWALREGCRDEFLARLISGPAELHPDSASGFFALLDAFSRGRVSRARATKGQMIGPLTLARCLNLKASDEHWGPWLGALALYLGRMATFQVEALSVGAPVIICIDEPALTPHPSPPEIAALEYLADTIHQSGAHFGIHTCAPAPWDLLTDLAPDWLSFDAQQGLPPRSSLASIFAIGIIPTDGKPAPLLPIEWLQSYPPQEQILSRTVVTPACGLAGCSLAQAKSRMEGCSRWLQGLTDISPALI